MEDANRRIVGAAYMEGDEDDRDFSLRPKWLEDFIGQEKVKEKLSIYIEAAKMRGDVLDHVILHGPPGLGKTTLSEIIANEMGVQVRVTSGPAIEKPGDLASILTNLSQGDVLFIDEIHRINRSVEEVLYPAMEDYALDIIIGKGTNARSLRIDLHPFTLIGATTRSGMLSSPLRDRFGVDLNMELYDNDHLAQIVKRSASILNIEITESGALEIAGRSRGTPRIANRILKRVRDYAQVRADGIVTDGVAEKALKMMEIDKLGLDNLDRRIVMTIIDNFDGGPVGIDTIAASLGEERITIEEVYEPYLLQIGFLNRTPRGRVLSRKAYEHYGVPYKTFI